MAGPAAPTTIDPSDGRRGRYRRRGRTARSPEQAASDRLAPERYARRPAARPRPRPDAKNFGGEVSFEPPSFTSLDHLVGAGEQRGGNLEFEGSCGLDIDDELELGRPVDRQGRPLRAFEGATGI